ncbi:MAG TPA: hypothetical protein VF380_02585 [Solirubrobacteraceae bacterium]
MPSSARRSPALRLRHLFLCVGCALLLGAASAPPAISAEATGGNAFSELAAGAGSEANTPTTKTITATKTSTETTTGTSKTVILLALVAAVILLSAIAFVIVRDARRVAPATEADLAEGEARSAHDAAVKLRKRRAKAKAARKQRKRTR